MSTAGKQSGGLAAVGRGLIRLPAAFLIFAVRLYQILLSPLLGRHCRFEPSCSAYFIGAVKQYGAVRGAARGLWRVCRCHPWNPGGYDPP
jgi:hypothetical protein